MPIYRFCGAFTEVSGVFEGPGALKKFGQSIDLSEDMARDIVLGGGSIIPASEFEDVAFTEQELSLYSDANSHMQANAAFLAKKKRALLACHQLRERLRAEQLKPASPASIAPPAEPSAEPRAE